MGRLAISYTGTSARGHVGLTSTWVADGAYAGDAYRYDQWGNMTEHVGWYKDAQEGFIDATYTQTFNAKNQLMKHPQTGATMTYDLAGNLKTDGTWALSYDATGQQTECRSGGMVNLTQSYDGDRMRVKKVEQGVTTYYVRSSMLGGQVVAELDASGQHKRGYIYLGGQLLAIQENNTVTWAHQDPVTKSQRFTNSAGVMQSQRVDLDPWGVETNRSINSQMQPHRFTTYERDANGSDEAMHRRYNSVRTRFDQPDPWDGSYELSDPQSFNRYSYVQNDPVNFVDPSGLVESLNCYVDGIQISCGAGFGLVNMGAAFIDIEGGSGFFGDILVIDQSSINGEGYLNIRQWVFFEPPHTESQRNTPPCPPNFLGIITGGKAVTDAFNKAFEKAQNTLVEHGGWVLMNRRGGLRSVLKSREGGDHRTGVQLGYPERHIGFRPGEVIVATFHAHVDDFGPDEGFGGDVDINTNRDRVPGIIIRASQIQGYGPERGLWRRDLPKRCQ